MNRDGKGFFLTLEGIEGAGKTTLAARLADAFTQAGEQVLVTREPGGDRIADSIRSLLLDVEAELVDRAELLLFEAARAQNVRNVIMPALDSGCLVICDRFADSSVAYQGSGQNIDREFIDTANTFATFGLVPDLTLVLDLPVEVGLGRQSATDRIGSVGREFHQRVREGFLAIAGQEPERVTVVDALLPAESVARMAFDLVCDRITKMQGRYAT